MKKLFTLLVCFASLSVAEAQIEFGVRAGGTFTKGHTDVAASTSSLKTMTIQTPVIENKSDGMGVGFIGGVYVQKQISPSGFFVQADVNYANFILKQKAENVQLTFDNTSEVNELKLDMKGNINLDEALSKSTLKGIDLSVGVGKHFFNRKFRVYTGINFLFVTNAEKEAKYSGASASLGSLIINGFTPEQLVGAGALAPEQVTGIKGLLEQNLNTQISEQFSKPSTEDLKKESVSQVKNTIIGVDLGIGTTIPKTGIGIDLRYSVPAFTGVLKNSTGKGFLGITTLVLSYSILKPEATASAAE